MYACGADSKVSWLRSQAARAFPLKVTLSSGWISPYKRLNPSQLRDSGRFSLRFPCRVMHADAVLLTWAVRKCKSFSGVLSYAVLSLSATFDKLLHAFGPRHWWPGDSPLEIAVGAILTQNTAWRNVEKAIVNMREKGLLDAQRLKTIDPVSLSEIIRPAGFYRIKAARLKSFIDFLWDEYGGSLERMGRVETETLRRRLLAVRGIGPETADSILLYALGKPIFVVDAYTFRFLRNHGLYTRAHTYEEVQSIFMKHLPLDTHLFNEFHALIVLLCQRFCKKKPLCESCPLGKDKEARTRK